MCRSWLDQLSKASRLDVVRETTIRQDWIVGNMWWYEGTSSWEATSYIMSWAVSRVVQSMYSLNLPCCLHCWNLLPVVDVKRVTCSWFWGPFGRENNAFVLKIGLFLENGVAFGGSVWSNNFTTEVQMKFKKFDLCSGFPSFRQVINFGSKSFIAIAVGVCNMRKDDRCCRSRITT